MSGLDPFPGPSRTRALAYMLRHGDHPWEVGGPARIRSGVPGVTANPVPTEVDRHCGPTTPGLPTTVTEPSRTLAPAYRSASRLARRCARSPGVREQDH